MIRAATWLLLSCFLLAGCQPELVREAPPATVTITQKCVAQADVPRVPPTAMPKTGTVDQLAAGAGADLLALDAYAKQADAILQQCAAP